MILVVGATGRLGGLIARRLLDDGAPVRMLVRDVPPQELVARGAQAVAGDLKDPGSLEAACAGAEAILTTANSIGRGGADTIESVDRDGNRNLVEAAVAAGASRFVFTSALGASPASPVPFLRAKAGAEELLRSSTLDWTILQPNLFMDTWVPAVVGGPALAGRPVTLVGDGRRRHSLVAMRDVAAYAVAVLRHPQPGSRTLTIGGPEPLSWHDVVRAFEAELGRELPITALPRGASVPGLPPFVSELLTALDTYDSPLDMTGPSSTYGIRPTPLADFVHDLVAEAAASPYAPA